MFHVQGARALRVAIGPARPTRARREDLHGEHAAAAAEQTEPFLIEHLLVELGLLVHRCASPAPVATSPPIITTTGHAFAVRSRWLATDALTWQPATPSSPISTPDSFIRTTEPSRS